jgi:hypothetical protein
MNTHVCDITRTSPQRCPQTSTISEITEVRIDRVDVILGQGLGPVLELLGYALALRTGGSHWDGCDRDIRLRFPCLFCFPFSVSLHSQSLPTPDSLNTRRPSTTTTTTTPTMDVQLSQNAAATDKISAYYSLVFPTITYYLQTPNVTIGRRCIPPNSPSSSAGAPQIDVDLGSLKSVSRLHANIEYDETEERWVLVVHGRNGAWVDGVWIQPGKRAPLNERRAFLSLPCSTICLRTRLVNRSQIQIASRTFHFELPPPPDTPPVEDMPSPATSHVSLQRERSPSVDITSISPDSSIPSCSPPPPPPPPVPDEKLRPASGKAEGAGKNAKPQPNPKKRKKSDIEVPIVKPEVMPPKPPYTYAQLCYRAIKAHNGKATLQDIIGWMIDSFEWYKYNVGSGWEVSSGSHLSHSMRV